MINNFVLQFIVRPLPHNELRIYKQNHDFIRASLDSAFIGNLCYKKLTSFYRCKLLSFKEYHNKFIN